MKKVFIMFMVSLLTFELVSCSSDDDDNVNANSIVGDWKGCNLKVYEDENLTNLIDEGPGSGYEFKFFADGTCIYRGYRSRNSCDYKLLNKEIYIYYDRSDYDIFYILEFSKSQMKLKSLNPYDSWTVFTLKRVD